jgi:hypothetical protein
MERLVRRSVSKEEDEMHRILSHEDEILPSSGFAVSVMEAVRREAAAPPPIPFPWKRALPGLVAGGLAVALALAAGVVAIAQLGRASTAPQLSMSLPSILPPILGSGLQHNLAGAASWTVLALLLALVSVKLSMRLASGRV